MTQKEYSEPSNWLFEKNIYKNNMFKLVIMGGTLLSIYNFLFTLFYAVILNIGRKMTEKPEWDSRPLGAHWFGP